MRRWLIPCALLFLVLAGCNSQKLIGLLTPAEEAADGQRYIDGIRSRNFSAIKNDTDPQYKESIEAALDQMAAAFPTGPIKSVKTVGSNTIIVAGATTYNLTYEYEFPNGWLLANIVLQKKAAVTKIEGIHLQSIPASLEQANAFTLTGKSALQYAFLVAVIFFAIFTITSAFACFRTPIPRRKWLWMIFVLVGLGNITLNWTTGALNMQPIGAVLFGAAYSQQLYGPVLIQMGIPLGAILFWWRRKKWLIPTPSPEASNIV